MEFDDLDSGVQSDSAELYPDEILPGSAEAAELSHAKANAERELHYLAESGSQSIDHRGRNTENNGRGPNGRKSTGRQIDTLALLAQQAYREAYNNPVTLNIGGREVRMSQGDLHKMLRERRAQLKERLEGTTDAAARAALEERLRALDEAIEDTDPNNGIIDPGRVHHVQTVIEGDPKLREWAMNGVITNNAEFEAIRFGANGHVQGIGDGAVPIVGGADSATAMSGEIDVNAPGTVGLLAISPTFGGVADPSNGVLDAGALEVVETVMHENPEFQALVTGNGVAAVEGGQESPDQDVTDVTEVAALDNTGRFTTYAATLDGERAGPSALVPFQTASLIPEEIPENGGVNDDLTNDGHEINNPTTISFG